MMEKKIAVHIERSADKSEEIRTYELVCRETDTVTEILERIRRYIDPSVSFHYSCRNGLCATCMIVINGKPALSCLAQVGEQSELKLRALPNFATITDLVSEKQ